MKRRWKVALGVGLAGLAAVAAPIAYIETQCGAPLVGLDRAARYRPLLAATDRRAEARTWLTYPEWHIVYSAESFGRFLRDNPPSAFPYGRHIAGFWSSYCRLNRATAGTSDFGDAKVMIYTIGISYSLELAVKAGYENTIGRLFEAVSGWRSADDRYAVRVQQRYGAFMNETPWYAFPFGDALTGLWRTREPMQTARHWERRAALSAEYGVKAGYAKLIGWASGATLGRDETRLRFVARGSADALQRLDPRFRVVRAARGGMLVVESPRYAQFTELVGKLASSPVALVEIAGNDDIFVTALVPRGARVPAGAVTLLSMPLDDRPGWRRVGLSTKVPRLLPLIRGLREGGGTVEHVYDY